MQETLDVQRVECPECETGHEIPISSLDVELIVSPYRLAFGDYTKIECSNGHTFWVYYC